MRYFPLYFDMQGTRVGVIGGGETALQKIRLLLKTPAEITVIAPELEDDLVELVDQNRMNWLEASPDEALLRGFDLLYAADDEGVNKKVADMATSLNIPLNVVDEPSLCNFITPALVDRAPLTVAIGTEGAAPVLAQQVKARIEQMLSPNVGPLTALAARMRDDVAARLASFKARRRFWHEFFKDAFGKFSVADVEAAALNRLTASADGAGESAAPETGRVYLVGAGAGTSDLLTFQAARLLVQADVVVYDRLVDASVLEVARRDARMVYVGKTPGGPCVPQEEINRILVREALDGQVVVRLKCGDPLIFGRAGEEMAALEAHDIPFELVPGVTAATACAAAAKLPLTEREGVRALVYLTGHSTEGLTPYDWSAFARNGTMLVLYMGVKMAARIEANLMVVGAGNNSRITIVENGGREDGRVLETRLGRLAQIMDREKVQHPAMIYIRLEMQAQEQNAALQDAPALDVALKSSL